MTFKTELMNAINKCASQIYNHLIISFYSNY
jgi:hypothetical protein